MEQTLSDARLVRMTGLEAQHPGDFCWAELACGAMGLGTHPGWLKEARDGVAECKQAADGDLGSCYCGKFARLTPEDTDAINQAGAEVRPRFFRERFGEVSHD